jgi:hypothetical protein
MKLDYMTPAGGEGVNPQWGDAAHTVIDVTVFFPHLAQEVRYTAAASDDPSAEHSEELFARAMAGDFGPIAPFGAP